MARASTLGSLVHRRARTPRLRAIAERVAMRLERGWAKTLIATIALIAAARIALPYVIEHYLDERLAALEGYTGDVADVDLALFRGAYRLEGIRIVKTDGGAPVPFFRAPAIDISLEWGALLDGRVVAEIVMERPELNVVTEGARRQTGEEADWRDAVDDMVPLTINRFVIRGGEVYYRDYTRDPQVNFRIDRLGLIARGLSNRPARGGALPARIHADARVQQSGRLVLDARLDPFAVEPTFNLALRLRELPATELNALLRPYAGVDAEGGTFFLYSEVRARQGRFRGYVKPMAEGLSLFRSDEEGTFFDVLGDALVQLVVEVFSNWGTDRLAVRVPISGTFESPETDGWAVVLSVLSNAFIRAIRHGLEDRGAWGPEQDIDLGGAPDHQPDRASELGAPSGA